MADNRGLDNAVSSYLALVATAQVDNVDQRVRAVLGTNTVDLAVRVSRSSVALGVLAARRVLEVGRSAAKKTGAVAVWSVRRLALASTPVLEKWDNFALTLPGQVKRTVKDITGKDVPEPALWMIVASGAVLDVDFVAEPAG